MKKKTSDGSSTPKKKRPAIAKKSGGELTDQPESGKLQENKSNDDDFPGYPHYPASQDILDPGNKVRKVAADVEDLSPLGSIKEKKSSADKGKETLAEKPFPVNIEEEQEEEEEKSNSDADVTKEDKELLGSDELNADMGDDEDLKKRVYDVDMTGDDLDVPGADLDDENEEIGEEDEENNSYSIGGDRHDDLEEGDDPGR